LIRPDPTQHDLKINKSGMSLIFFIRIWLGRVQIMEEGGRNASRVPTSRGIFFHSNLVRSGPVNYLISESNIFTEIAIHPDPYGKI
jgi:hypothetical protein